MEKRVRTGCITCRKRRVKCDEAKPICCRCRSASVLCEGYSILRQVMCVHRSPASPFYETISFPKTSCRHLDWRQDQLLLYHHFVTTTAVRLFRDEHIRFWRDEVAQMSYKLDFVYEALRAISAIHRAVLLGRQNGNAHDAAKSRFVGIHAYSNVLGLLPSYLMPTTPIENIAILVVLVFLTYVESLLDNPTAAFHHLWAAIRLLRRSQELKLLSEADVSNMEPLFDAMLHHWLQSNSIGKLGQIRMI